MIDEAELSAGFDRKAREIRLENIRRSEAAAKGKS